VDDQHVVFIDVLGIRRALSTGHSSVAETRLRRLSEIVCRVLRGCEGVHAHGATDFFILWSREAEFGWDTALAASRIFKEYFDLNEEEDVNDVLLAYLLRGGLAYGQVGELRKAGKRVSYSILLGDGLGTAYEAQALRKGMRLIVAPGATKAFQPRLVEGDLADERFKIFRHYRSSGAVDYAEISWVGSGGETDRRVGCAAKLFRSAVTSFKKNMIPEGVLLHYQQTLCAVLEGCSTAEVLLRYLTYLHSNKKASDFLGPIWSTAWLRLFGPKHARFLEDHRDVLHERFLLMSGSPHITEVSRVLNRHNRWRSLIRFLRSGRLRFQGTRSGSIQEWARRRRHSGKTIEY
jgi:hypothetical protein